MHCLKKNQIQHTTYVLNAYASTVNTKKCLYYIYIYIYIYILITSESNKKKKMYQNILKSIKTPVTRTKVLEVHVSYNTFHPNRDSNLKKDTDTDVSPKCTEDTTIRKIH